MAGPLNVRMNDPESSHLLLTLISAFVLSTTCGLRAFLPPFLVSGMAYLGWVTLPEELEWLSDPTVLVVLGGIAAAEFFGYYVPFLDNGMDLLEAPSAALVGGAFGYFLLAEHGDAAQVAMAAAGGGSALTLELVTASMRAAASGLTLGCANNCLSSLENTLALLSTVLALLMPLVALALLVLLVVVLTTKARAWLERRTPPAPAPAPAPDGG